MTNKFTEEQYQKIVGLQKDKFEPTILSTARTNNYDFWYNLGLSIENIRDFVFDNNLYEELAAIANPLTREWAHDKFVEKEKKYYWTHKNKNKIGIYEDNGLVFLKERHWAPLTESEIKSWGYNPEIFNREEINYD